jgi:hypothetical protein
VKWEKKKFRGLVPTRVCKDTRDLETPRIYALLSNLGRRCAAQRVSLKPARFSGMRGGQRAARSASREATRRGLPPSRGTFPSAFFRAAAGPAITAGFVLAVTYLVAGALPTREERQSAWLDIACILGVLVLVHFSATRAVHAWTDWSTRSPAARRARAEERADAALIRLEMQEMFQTDAHSFAELLEKLAEMELNSPTKNKKVCARIQASRIHRLCTHIQLCTINRRCWCVHLRLFVPEFHVSARHTASRQDPLSSGHGGCEEDGAAQKGALAQILGCVVLCRRTPVLDGGDCCFLLELPFCWACGDSASGIVSHHTTTRVHRGVVCQRLQGMHIAPVAHRLQMRVVDHVDH